MKVRRPLLVALLVGTVLSATGPMAWAAFQDRAEASSTFTTDVLQPPSGLSASPDCGLLLYEVDLTWTATTSTWLDGYQVLMSTSESGSYDVVPLPLAGDPKATTRTIDGLSASTTYWFVVRATKGGWRAATAPVSATTSAVCLL